MTAVPEADLDEVEGSRPEHEAVLADSVGLALLVVLDTLAPAERLAFVLHDMYGVPFDEIAEILGRSPTAARQLASRARRRVQSPGADIDVDRQRQRQVVGAFLAASRRGDFDGPVERLDPGAVARAAWSSTARTLTPTHPSGRQADRDDRRTGLHPHRARLRPTRRAVRPRCLPRRAPQGGRAVPRRPWTPGARIHRAGRGRCAGRVVVGHPRCQVTTSRPASIPTSVPSSAQALRKR